MVDVNATEHESADEAAAPPQGSPGDEFMGLLAEHVPLALLADLAAPTGPRSAEILEAEGLPDNAWWETADSTPAPPGTDDPAPPTGDGGEETASA